MTVEAWIIHLARAEERRPNVAKLGSGLPFPVNVLSACDARAMDDAARALVYRPEGLHAPAYPFRLTDGEIACFLSHRAAWKQVAQSGCTAGLVLEDDAAIDPDVFGDALALALEKIEEHRIIQFPARKLRGPAKEIASRGKNALLRPQMVSLGAVCTLYSREAAEQLLPLTETFDRPVDTFLQMGWITGLHPRLVLPAGISEISATMGGSTIQKKRKPGVERLAREWARWNYRRKVRAFSVRLSTF